MVKINQNQAQYITYGQMNLINDFRKLWTDVVIWLRSHMVSTITGFSNIETIHRRIEQIPADMAQRLQQFLGVESAERFQSLLSMYLNNAQILVDAMNNNDQELVNRTVVQLYRNADTMADFLASINPYWSKAQWQNLFHQLTDMGISEVVAMFSGEYDREIDIRERLLRLALVLGDYMAQGVMHFLDPGLFQEYPDSNVFPD
jgi:hypothetical protein